MISWSAAYASLANGLGRVLRVVKAYRYAVLCLALFTLVVCHLKNGQLYGDFWEHAAVVTEYSQAAWSPHNPIVGTDAPHKGLHPYHLLVGTFARLCKLDAIDALSVFSLLNLLFLAQALRRFVERLLGRPEAAFWALLLILFLWPERPWIYSAFFHIRAIALVAAYPSTFAMGLTFSAFSLYLTVLRGGSRRLYAPLALLAALTTLIHPMTAIFCWLGLAALLVTEGRPALAMNLPWFTALGVGAACGVLAWPHYSFVGLVTGGSEASATIYHQASATFYADATRFVYPLLVTLPAVGILAIARRPARPLLVLLATLLALYGAGAWTGKAYYGRSISFIAIMLQISLADWLAGCEQACWRLDLKSVARGVYLALVLGVAVFCIEANAGPAVEDHIREKPRTYRDLGFVRDHVGPYEVVLVDRKNAFTAPAFGIKVVAHRMPLLFVPDAEQRKRDRRIFFSSSASVEQRREILARYQVRFVFFSRGSGGARLEQQLAPLARTVQRRSDLVLMKVLGASRSGS